MQDVMIDPLATAIDERDRARRGELSPADLVMLSMRDFDRARRWASLALRGIASAMLVAAEGLVRVRTPR